MTDISKFIPGQKGNLPQQPKQVNLNIDINALPDIVCIKCGESEFNNITRIKKLSATISPQGKEGNVNISMLRCSNPACRWLFNPQEYLDNEKAKEKTKPVKDKKLSVVKKSNKEKEPNFNKTMCRKCGIFYEKGSKHTCA